MLCPAKHAGQRHPHLQDNESDERVHVELHVQGGYGGVTCDGVEGLRVFDLPDARLAGVGNALRLGLACQVRLHRHEAVAVGILRPVGHGLHVHLRSIVACSVFMLLFMLQFSL